MTKGTKVAGLIIAASLLAAGCGSSDDKADQATPSTTAPSGEMPGGSVVPGGVTNPVPSLTDCAEDAEGTTASVDAAPIGGVNGAMSGTIEAEITDVAVITEPIGEKADLSPDAPQGRYVAVRYQLTNNTDKGIAPANSFGSYLHLTDGEATWGEADFENEHGGVSTTYSESKGENPTEIGAGFDGARWVVFDIPTSKTPTAIALGSESSATGPWACFTLPQPIE